MVNLSEFVGDTPLRISLVKKREKQSEKLKDIIAKHMLRVAPISAEIDMYSEMIAAIDRRNGVATESERIDVFENVIFGMPPQLTHVDLFESGSKETDIIKEYTQEDVTDHLNGEIIITPETK